MARPHKSGSKTVRLPPPIPEAEEFETAVQYADLTREELITLLEDERKQHTEEISAAHRAAEIISQDKSASKLRFNLRVKSFPGVDWSKPAMRVIAIRKTPDNQEINYDGDMPVNMMAGKGQILNTVTVHFDDGLFVTNDMTLASMLARTVGVLAVTSVV